MRRTLPATTRAALALTLCATACGLPVIEREGRRVFNPAWAWALEFARDDWQKPEEVLCALALPEDAVVADIGAGGGYLPEAASASGPSEPKIRARSRLTFSLTSSSSRRFASRMRWFRPRIG